MAAPEGAGAKQGRAWTMRTMLLVGVGLVGLSLANVRAEEQPAAAPAAEPAKVETKARAPKPELKNLAVVGTVQKAERKRKDGSIVTTFSLIAENGTEYALRAPRQKDAPGDNLADFAGMKVKITGRGSEGRRNIIPFITSIEKVDQAPAAAPVAAPEPAPAPEAK